MQLTKYTDNSLRVLMFLALRPDELGTIPEISEKFHMSKNHLMKVVHQLSLRGYIQSVQGRGGGIRLAIPPEKITIGMVVREMETTLDLIDCEASNCPIMSICKLKVVVNKATKQFLSVLDEYTLADLIKPKSKLKVLVG